MNPKEVLLLNAISSISLTLFAKQFCIEAEYKPELAIEGVEIFINGLREGLLEHCELLKVPSENKDVPDFLQKFFESSGKERNQEVDASLETVLKFIDSKMRQTIETMCAVHNVIDEMKNRKKNTEQDSDEEFLDQMLKNSFPDVHERIKDFLPKKKETPAPQEKPPQEQKPSQVEFPNQGEYDDLFRFHPNTPGRAKKHEGIREYATQYSRYIEEVCPNSAERTLAIRRLQETMMWANSSLAIHEKE